LPAGASADAAATAPKESLVATKPPCTNTIQSITDGS
jgi:hypothetical protein